MATKTNSERDAAAIELFTSLSKKLNCDIDIENDGFGKLSIIRLFIAENVSIDYVYCIKPMVSIYYNEHYQDLDPKNLLNPESLLLKIEEFCNKSKLSLFYWESKV